MSNRNRQKYFNTDNNNLQCPGVQVHDDPENIDITIDPKLHPMSIGKRRETVDKLRTKQYVKIQTPQKGEIRNPDTVKLDRYQQDLNDMKKEIFDMVDQRINYLMENMTKAKLNTKPVEMCCSNSNQNPKCSFDFLMGNGDQWKRPPTNTDKINITREFQLSVSSKANKNSDVSSVQTEFQNSILNKFKQDNGGIDSNDLKCTPLADSKILQSKKGETNEGSKSQVAESMVTQMITISRQDKKYQKSEIIDNTEQTNVCKKISRETGVKIEIFPEKDNSTFLLNGNKDGVGVSKLKIAANFPIKEKIIEIVLNVPTKYHSYFLNRQAEVKKQIISENNGVSIVFPPMNSVFSGVFINGPKYFVKKVKNKINAIVNDLEQRDANEYRDISQQDCVCASSIDKELITIEMTIDPELHSMIIGKKGETVDKMRAKYDVKIKIPQKWEIINPDSVKIVGYRQNVENAKNEILKMVDHRKNCYKRKIFIEPQILSRIIGFQWSRIKKTMDEYHVYIKQDSANPNLFTLYPEYGFTRHEINDLIECNQKSQGNATYVMGNDDQWERTQANTNTNSTRNSPSFVGTENIQQ
ncbi:K Homology domain,K homology domain-like, alpha/beta,K Homology domain, type 1 [Cinara cedri]|uniref:K Homology domain,K homology domain-like, alpha/beta,K Homology domain, type 1 n=1 Tax=Cinara cedri TaxID=506608 RepID=A0A5E4ME24_9HEMI|nr:K Homology domain,K homology domain-like, alpha/beta,K Homology domain, type 1 [Cinara cedri]